MDIALHRARADVEEDLDYYFSDRRDKHNQIRPADDILSLAADSPTALEFPQQDKISSAFHPFEPFSLDRIFIGVSFPLFSNNWGAAFLRHLLGLIRPDGAIILPVYPEVQARDQGLWCRSSLENIFRSRSRFIGVSNIWAENDGVMSVRVGRRWPPVVPSTARWLFEQTPTRGLALELEQGRDSAAAELWETESFRFWRIGRHHAVIEQILRHHCGPRRPVRLVATGEDAGLFALECLYSPYTRVIEARVRDTLESPEELQALDQVCATRAHGPLRPAQTDETPCDVLCVTGPHRLDPDLAAQRLAPGGLLILTPECAAENPTFGDGFGEPEYYSDIVAQRLHPGVPIYHYSERIEAEIDRQAETRRDAFTIVRKL